MTILVSVLLLLLVIKHVLYVCNKLRTQDKLIHGARRVIASQQATIQGLDEALDRNCEILDAAAYIKNTEIREQLLTTDSVEQVEWILALVRSGANDIRARTGRGH